MTNIDKHERSMVVKGDEADAAINSPLFRSMEAISDGKYMSLVH